MVGSRSTLAELPLVDEVVAGYRRMWGTTGSATGLRTLATGTSRGIDTGERLSRCGQVRIWRRFVARLRQTEHTNDHTNRLYASARWRNSRSCLVCPVSPTSTATRSITLPFHRNRVKANSSALRRSSTAGSSPEGMSIQLELTLVTRC